MAQYICVKWLHKNADDPVDLYSELDGERYEVRKVEVFADGRRGFADATEEKGSMLGTMPVPSLDEINTSPEFEAREISEEEFQRIWLKRR